MLEIMLQRPAFLEKARDAARSDDDDRLWRCLFEASRFKPINPGPFRRCGEDYVVAKGTRRAKTIRKGEILLVSTQSAMFDDRRVTDPWTYNPDRPRTDYMIFGHGLHWCLGALIAEAQITQTLKALLTTANLRRADGVDGTLRHLGSFPQHLVVTFDRQRPDR
jgi:cytochrome P450